jgi:hypothetical protein
MVLQNYAGAEWLAVLFAGDLKQIEVRHGLIALRVVPGMRLFDTSASNIGHHFSAYLNLNRYPAARGTVRTCVCC